MYIIEFVIGDWSSDGHSQKESYLVKSSVPVQDLREIHFKAEEVLGFDIGDLCSQYHENWISRDRYEYLQDLLKWEVNEDIDEEYWSDTENRYYIEDIDELLSIWLDCLRYVDPSVILTVCNDTKYPTIHFYGYDKKKRHLNTPGYGLFD